MSQGEEKVQKQLFAPQGKYQCPHGNETCFSQEIRKHKLELCFCIFIIILTIYYLLKHLKFICLYECVYMHITYTYIFCKLPFISSYSHFLKDLLKEKKCFL